MRDLTLILLFWMFTATSFSQWKSYYPEEIVSKEKQKESSREKNKKLFDIHFFNAITAKSLGDYEEALKHFDKCINIDQKNPISFYESAIINSENGNYEIAIEQIKIALKLDPQNRWYLLLYANTLFSKQDFYNSAAQYKKLLTLEPENQEIYFKLSDAYIYANDFKKAITVYNEIEKKRGLDKTLSIQ